jgi:DNA-binding NarL/FixJ family response regulator
VKVHIQHIMDKLGASDRTQAITIAVRRGIIRL